MISRDQLWITISWTIMLCLLSGIHFGSCGQELRTKNRELSITRCENEEMTITCPEGHKIDVKHAVYGRYSIRTCNPNSDNYITGCGNKNSTKAVMQRRCNGRSACITSVSLEQMGFADPCPDTPKFLEVIYRCVDDRVVDTTTTLATTSVSTSTEKQYAADKLFDIKNPEERSELKVPAETSYVADNFVPELPHFGTAEAQKPAFCPELFWRHIRWPTSIAGSTITQPCPNNRNVYAIMLCGADTSWQLNTLDVSRCESEWLQEVEALSSSKEIQSVESLLLAVDKLVLGTSSEEFLYGANVQRTAALLSRLVNVTLNQSGKFGLAQLEALRKITRQLLLTANNLLADRNDESWKDLHPGKSVVVASSILSSIERQGELLAKAVAFGGSNEIIENTNIMLEVSTINIQREKLFRFPGKSIYKPDSDFIQLPEEALNWGSENNIARVVFVSYDKVGDYMTPSDRLVEHKGELILVKRRVVSKIISAAVNFQHNVDDLKTPVLFTVATPVAKVENVSNPQCVFWSTTSVNREYLGDDVLMGEWSPVGCSVLKHNETHTTCACDHLTNFAVLMDINGIELEEVHHLSLIFITSVGCVISIVCLFCAIFVFQYFCTDSDRVTIHKNLCFCLLIAEIVFLCGIGQVQFKIACSIVAAVLHYFFLAAFAWMLLEGIQIYFMLVQVFEEYGRRKYFYFFGYGMPLVIVGIALGIDYNSYGTEKHCWLNTENYFIFSFIGPVLVVLFANLLFLLLAIVIVCRYNNNSDNYVQKHSGARGSISSTDFRFATRVKGALLLIFLLGLTWSFGFIYVNESTVLFAYLFTILNSLQGLFIFLFHVAFNEKIRAQALRWFERNNYLKPISRNRVSEYYYYTKTDYEKQRASTACSSQTSSSATSTQSCLTKLLGLKPRRNKRCSTQLLLEAPNMSNNGKHAKMVVAYPGVVPCSFSHFSEPVACHKTSGASTDTTLSCVVIDEGINCCVTSSEDPASPGSSGLGSYRFQDYPSPPSFKPPPVPVGTPTLSRCSGAYGTTTVGGCRQQPALRRHCDDSDYISEASNCADECGYPVSCSHGFNSNSNHRSVSSAHCELGPNSALTGHYLGASSTLLNPFVKLEGFETGLMDSSGYLVPDSTSSLSTVI